MRSWSNSSVQYTVSDPFFGWDGLFPFLPEDFRELAHLHKQVQTQFGNAKITTPEDLLRFVFSYVQLNKPLRQTVAAIEKAGGPRLSAMRLHMKMRQAAPYLHALVERLVPERLHFDVDAWGGLEFVAVDSIEAIGPYATCTQARVHAVMRLGDMRITAVNVTDGGEAESLKRFLWAPGQVIVGGRRYADPGAFARARQQDAHVLVRINENSLPLLDPYGAPLRLDEKVRQLQGTGAAEWPARLPAPTAQNGHTVLEGRVIARVRPPEAFRPESTGQFLAIGDKASESLAMTGVEPRDDGPVVMVFTTLPRTRVTRDALMDAYFVYETMRESVARCPQAREGERLSPHRDDVTLSWLYTKLLLNLLYRRADAASREGLESEPKTIPTPAPSAA